MRYGKKAISMMLAFLAICTLIPIQALAVGTISTEEDISLTLNYSDFDTPIPNGEFSVYKIADVDEYAQMALTDEFEAYAKSVEGLQKLDQLDQVKWTALASTLKSIVQKDNLTVAAEGKTDSEGKLELKELKPGLYLVIGKQPTELNSWLYSAVPFLVFLPEKDLKADDWNYTVNADVKYTKNEHETITRKVLKRWEDEGYETLRPTQVEAQLLRDGTVYDTKILNKDNDWRYEWNDLDPAHEWEVTEKQTDGYTLTVVRTGVTYVLVNTYKPPVIGVDPPVQKRIIGDTPVTNATFTFVLTAKDSSYPMPEGSSGGKKELQIVGAQKKEFGYIEFTKPGTYVYEVSEKNTGTAGYTYDTTLYTLTFTVTEENGEFKVTSTATDQNGKECDSLVFTNTYKTTGGRLPQTGVLWWPVPILFSTGLVFLIIGIVRRRRYS